MSPEEAAQILYEEYCIAVGGKAFNGDPLPTWEEFSKDDNKIIQYYAWLHAAGKLLEKLG